MKISSMGMEKSVWGGRRAHRGGKNRSLQRKEEVRVLRGSGWKCWASDATETSKRDVGWEQAFGICPYKATHDRRGIWAGEGVAPLWTAEGSGVLGILPKDGHHEGRSRSPLLSPSEQL